jgi:deoxyribonuclease-4
MSIRRREGGPLLGAHVSIAGGFDKAPLRGKAAGCRAIQVFTKSRGQWQARPLPDAEANAFRANLRASGIIIAVAHGSYLINLGSPDPALRRKSLEACREELERAETLGIPYLVIHPGSHLGRGEAAGLRLIAQALDLLLEETKGFRVQIVLETTAGQGTNLGSRFEHLAHLFERAKHPERLGVCLDTCHLFAAGCEIRTEEGYEKTMEAFDRLLGVSRLKILHLSDSKQDLGSRVDRHEHIGKGFLGLNPFRFILNDERLQGLPMILETPKDGDPVSADRRNLAVLRRLTRRKIA